MAAITAPLLALVQQGERIVASNRLYGRTTQLLNQLTLQVLLKASAAPDSALGKALATAIVVSADQMVSTLE